MSMSCSKVPEMFWSLWVLKVWASLNDLFHFHHSIWSDTLQDPQTVQVSKNRNNFENIMMGDMMVVISTSDHESPNSFPWISQHIG